MIDVALTPAEGRPAEVAVVIDVLRATSTVTQALASGYRAVLCADGIARARALALRVPGRVLAGERGCVKPPGFALGNSPLGTLGGEGRELVLATTNGTPAIVAAARRCGEVLLGSLLNLAALADALSQAKDVSIVCAGTDGDAALEDVYAAGRLVRLLAGSRTDAALVAAAVSRAYAGALDALSDSADAAVLVGAGLKDDIAYCALESELDVVARVVAAGDGVARVTAGSQSAVGIGATVTA